VSGARHDDTQTAHDLEQLEVSPYVQRLSVVIANYNYADFVGAAIESA